MQQKVFSTSLTKFVALSVPAAGIAVALVLFGLKERKLMAYDDGTFPPGWIFYDVPWALAAILALGLTVLFFGALGKKIVVTPKHVEILRGSKQLMRQPWRDVSFTPPRPDQQGGLRTALLSDGKHFERIDPFFWPDFDLIVEVSKTAKQSARDDLST